MTGLLYKEFYMIKAQIKIWLVIFVVIFLYNMTMKSDSILHMLTPMVGIMTCLSSFSYDRMFRCEEYIAAMPVSRKKIVMSKYTFFILLSLGTTLLTLLGFLALGYPLGETTAASLGILGATIALQMIMIPLIYKWGPEKARILFLVICFSPYLLSIFLKDRFSNISDQFLLDILKVSPLILLILFAISYFISARIYSKKDF